VRFARNNRLLYTLLPIRKFIRQELRQLLSCLARVRTAEVKLQLWLVHILVVSTPIRAQEHLFQTPILYRDGARRKPLDAMEPHPSG
jgi:hypothetical protein